MKNLWLLLLLTVPCILISTPIDTVWSKTYEGSEFLGTDEMIYSNGSLVFTGGTWRTRLWSTDQQGSLQYTHAFVDTIEGQVSGRVLYPLEADSVLLITAESSYSSPLDSWTGIHRLAPDGSVLDSAYIQTPHHFFVTEIDQFQDGSYIVSGADIITSLYPNPYQQRLMRFSALGDSLWSISYYGNAADTDTSFTDGAFMDVAVSTTDDVYAIGTRNYRNPSQLIQLDFTKTRDNGTLQWSLLLDGYSGSAVEIAGDNQIFIAGTHYMDSTSYATSQVFIAEVDTSGNLLSSGSFDLGGGVSIKDMILNAAGNLVVTGFRSPEDQFAVYVAEISLECDTLWTKHMSVPTYISPHSIVEIDRDNYFIGAEGDQKSLIYYLAPNGVFTEKWSSHKPAEGMSNPRVFPNPSNNLTAIQFEMYYPNETVMTIFEIGGRQLLERDLGLLYPGQHEVFWNGVNSAGAAVSSGTYFVKISSSTQSKSSRIVLLK